MQSIRTKLLYFFQNLSMLTTWGAVGVTGAGRSPAGLSTGSSVVALGVVGSFFGGAPFATASGGFGSDLPLATSRGVGGFFAALLLRNCKPMWPDGSAKAVSAANGMTSVAGIFWNVRPTSN